MSGHLGEALSALVDGQLDHDGRERALAHLAHCGTCRAEVDAHRRLKASLGALREAPAPSPDLTARLLAVSSSPAALAGPPLTPRPSRRPAGAARPLGRAVRRPRRTAATAGMLLVAGLAGALALGAPTTSGPRAPVDPASPVLLVDHLSTTSEVPLTVPAASLVPAGLGR